MEQQYKEKETIRRVFSISAQHYAFVVNAFVALVEEYGENKYEFTLRESRTHDIIEDVRTSRSELHSTVESPKNIVVTDRATLFNLLIGLDGYTISSGILSSDLNGNNIVAIPLESNETMEIGYIAPADRRLNPVSERYLEHLKKYIMEYQ